MKQKLSSLWVRMLLPVIIMTLFVVILLTTLFSRAFIDMILRQENEVNAVGFDTVSHSITPLINTSVDEVRRIMADDRVAAYARLQYVSDAELVRARMDCRDYLRGETARRDGIFGLLFMRTNGSLFGVLPEGNFFLDDPEKNPLPETVKTRILNVPLGQTVWAGPLAGAAIYGFENEQTPRSIMIAGWKSVNVDYGECYALMLMDETIFEGLFAPLQDDKSVWRLFTADQTEIYHTGEDACPNPERLISESNSGDIFQNDYNQPVCAFSMKMDSPAWTVVREVSMANYEQVVQSVRRSVALIAGAVFLIGTAFYYLWLKRRMPQFDSLLNGIIRMGEGDLNVREFKPTSINEFKRMQQEINKTSQALQQQMETIRQMTAEKEHISTEMNLAREIQVSVLPMVFPPFPERKDIDLYASMTPAKEVGGDFYDFFMVDDDHLALVIADVSGKGIPASLFMMVAKSLIKSQLLNGCDPARAMELVNLRILEGNTSSTFVTVWAAVIELSTGKGLVCNAGHEHPAIRRADGPFELLKYRHNMFVGASKKAKYQNREFEMHPGDCLFVYTDGVPEAQNAHKEMFGEGRLTEALNRHPDAVPEELLSVVRKAVDDFVGETPQFDDLTMLAFRYNGAAPEAETCRGIIPDESV